MSLINTFSTKQILNLELYQLFSILTCIPNFSMHSFLIKNNAIEKLHCSLQSNLVIIFSISFIDSISVIEWRFEEGIETTGGRETVRSAGATIDWIAANARLRKRCQFHQWFGAAGQNFQSLPLLLHGIDLSRQPSMGWSSGAVPALWDLHPSGTGQGETLKLSLQIIPHDAITNHCNDM